MNNNTWTLFYLKKTNIKHVVDFHYNLIYLYCGKANSTLSVLEPAEPAKSISIINLIDSFFTWKSENS